MHALPPLNALRAFEAAARHLSLTKAAAELNVSPGAVSHQIRGLEALLGVELFERRARAVVLTASGKLLYPGLQTGFLHIREAVAGLKPSDNERVLVISTPPGLTSKWLAGRLYRFSSAHPEIDTRISSSLNNANFATDGVDLAIRNMPDEPPHDAALVMEKLVSLSLVPVCSPKLIESSGPLDTAARIARAPLIHDDTLTSRAPVPTWSDWFAAAGLAHVEIARGLSFNSADHALDAASEGAGVLLVQNILAYDMLRGGRLVIPVKLALPSGRAYFLVRPKRARERPQARAFIDWLKQEFAALDWSVFGGAEQAAPSPRMRGEGRDVSFKPPADS
jgi:LysR family transcriptional regulator, glycine cleavage system transcriptional activator